MSGTKRFLRNLRIAASIGLVAWVLYCVGQWFERIAQDPYAPPKSPYVSVTVNPNHELEANLWLHRTLLQIIDFWRIGN